MLIEVQCRVSGPVTRMPATVAREPHTPFTPGFRQGPGPGRENRATKRGEQTPQGPSSAPGQEISAAGNAGTQGAEEQWELRGGSSSRLKLSRCIVCENALESREGLHLPAGPQHGSWRC